MAAFEHARIGARHTGRVDTSLALADTVAIEHAHRVWRNAAAGGGGMPVRTGGRGQHHHGCRGKQQSRGDGSSAAHVPASMVTHSRHVSPPRVATVSRILGSINGHLARFHGAAFKVCPPPQSWRRASLPSVDPQRMLRRQSGYSSFRNDRGSSGPFFGVRSARKPKYGATNGSGADTV